MSCQGPGTPTFAVLGGPGGWRAATSEGLAGVEPVGPLTLSAAAPSSGSVGRAQVDALLAPSWLAADGAGGWGLVADGTLRHAIGCDDVAGLAFVDTGAVVGAVATDRTGRVALSRPNDGAVEIYGRGLRRRLVRLSVPEVDAGTLVGWGQDSVLLLDPVRGSVTAVSLTGAQLWTWTSPLLVGAERLGLVRGADGSRITVAAVRLGARIGWWRLYPLDRRGAECLPLAFGGLTSCLVQPVQTADDAFAIPDPPRAPTWFDRTGRSLADPIPPQPELARRGFLRSELLDAGDADAQWFRARLDADQPPGTSIRLLATAFTDDGKRSIAGGSYAAPNGATDLLLHLSRARMLQVELELVGDGQSTPTVRELWLEADSSSTLDLLPAIFRRDAAEADFLRRFLALFDAELADIDDVIREAHSLLDPNAATDPARLTALASLVGLEIDPAWDPARVRDLLRRPALLAGLGTAGSVTETISLLLGVDVLVEELGQERTWAVVGGPRAGEVRPLGTARLYGRTTRANLLGRTGLGSAPLIEPVDAEIAADREGAFEVVVHVAAAAGRPIADRVLLQRTLRQLLPAHLDVTVRLAEEAMVLGGTVLVGIDTIVAPAPTGCLAVRRDGTDAEEAGDPAGVRLGGTVLAGGGGGVVTVGRRAQVGVDSNVA